MRWGFQPLVRRLSPDSAHRLADRQAGGQADSQQAAQLLARALQAAGAQAPNAPLAGRPMQPGGTAGLAALLEQAALLADTGRQLLAPDRRAPAGGAPMHDQPCLVASDLTCLTAELAARMQDRTRVATGALRHACSTPWSRRGRAGRAAAAEAEQARGRGRRLEPAA
jgi:hypothetical protein